MIETISNGTGNGTDLKKTKRQRNSASGHSVDRLPPHSDEMERGVLGCILLSPNDCMGECIEKLKDNGKEAFYDLRHQTIYEALTTMFDTREAIDIITLQQRLKDKGLLDQIGGIPYLSQLQDAVPSAANLSYYLESVREKFLLRKMISVCT
ncbi:MAG TPA: DnaB-like helicase N-terminal domain-containing protein, partial [Candidatus Acidoferrales bacterium]|nr:DnaB-like helicase N-terminal domain-containing protein [Candidatus Acidoferrales bacterium]